MTEIKSIIDLTEIVGKIIYFTEIVNYRLGRMHCLFTPHNNLIYAVLLNFGLLGYPEGRSPAESLSSEPLTELTSFRPTSDISG